MCDDTQRANTDFINRTIKQLPTNTVHIYVLLRLP